MTFTVGSVISGKDLKNVKCYRLTNKKEIHRNFQYKDGLNIDPVKFSPSEECSPGGMYFFSEEQIYMFGNYAFNVYWIREVTFPDDAQIYVEKNKFKCDKFILGPRKKFCLDDFPEEVQIAAVQNRCDSIQYIEKPSEKVQMAAVQKNGLSIRYINNPSENIQIAAIQNRCDSIYYIEKPSENVQMTAVQKNGYAIKYINNPSENVQMAAVQQNGYAIKLIKNPSEKVLEYVQQEIKMIFM